MSQKRASGPLQLELQAIGSCPAWMLRIGCRFPGRTGDALYHCTISRAYFGVINLYSHPSLARIMIVTCAYGVQRKAFWQHAAREGPRIGPAPQQCCRSSIALSVACSEDPTGRWVPADPLGIDIKLSSTGKEIRMLSVWACELLPSPLSAC